MGEHLTHERQTAVEETVNAAASAFGILVAGFEQLLDTHGLTVAHQAIHDQIDNSPVDGIQWMLTVAVGREAIRRQAPDLPDISGRPDPETGAPLPPGVDGYDPTRPLWRDPNNELTAVDEAVSKR